MVVAIYILSHFAAHDPCVAGTGCIYSHLLSHRLLCNQAVVTPKQSATALMVKLVDTPDLKSVVRKDVPVRLRLGAQS